MSQSSVLPCATDQERIESSMHIEQHFKNSKRVHHFVIQPTEEGHTPLHPLPLWLVCEQLHAHRKVSGVSCGREGSPHVADFVEEDSVGGTLGDFIPLARLQPRLDFLVIKRPT